MRSRRIKALASAVLCSVGCVVAAGSASGAAGHLDRSFGDGGLVTEFEFGYADAVTTDARGRVVAVGRAEGAAVVMRYTTAGRRDRSFSRNGMVLTGAVGGRAVAMDSGRILTAGSNSNSFNVARYRTNGRLDHSFSGDGTTTTDMGGNYEVVDSVAVDSKGRIVLGGYIHNRKRGGLLAVARYLPNGRLDDSFGTHGKLTTSFPHSAGGANGVALDSKDRIVAVGVGGTSDFAVARYRRSGKLDRSFGVNGSVTTGFGTYANANSVVIDRKDQIVAAGPAGGDLALARYRPGGRLDRTFGTRGKVITDLGERGAYLYAAARGPRGRVVLAGRHDGRFALARYRASGTLDRSFSDDGLVRKPGGGAYALAVDSEGRPVAAGFHANQFALVRYKGR